MFSDGVGSKHSGGDRRSEYHDNDEEFTLERTCTKTTEKITANRKSRLTRRETKEDADQRVIALRHAQESCTRNLLPIRNVDYIPCC